MQIGIERKPETIQPTQSSITSIEEPFQQIQIGKKKKIIISRKSLLFFFSYIEGLSADLQGFPLKPKTRCTLGRDIRLYANHYVFQLNKPFTIIQYDINMFKVYNDKDNKEVQKEVKQKETSKYKLNLQMKIFKFIFIDYIFKNGF